jgi:hypothetical protein
MIGADDLQAQAKGPAAIARSDRRARSWALLLFDAASRNGITPISKLRFHRLAYLANGMSRVFEIDAADERIVKHRRGPFYPDLQWHVDRLVGQFLISVAAVRHYQDDDGTWMDADYALGPCAVPVIESLCQLDSMTQLSIFLQEVARAYAAQEDSALDEIILKDVTYDYPGRATNAVINFRAERDNLSARTAESFSLLAPDPRALALHDKINLYVEYIDRRPFGAAA